MKAKIKYKILNMRYLIVIGLLLSLNVNGQKLEEYLLIASKNNSEIKAAYTEFEIAMQKSPQVKSLPDPTLTLSAFGRMVETRVGAQEARFSIMQMFPWFGTLAAKENVAMLAGLAFNARVNAHKVFT